MNIVNYFENKIDNELRKEIEAINIIQQESVQAQNNINSERTKEGV